MLVADMNAIQLFAVVAFALIVAFLCVFGLHHTKDIEPMLNRAVSQIGLVGLLGLISYVAIKSL